MGIMLGGKERTRAQWEHLISTSGLKLKGIQQYNFSLCGSVIVLSKP